MNEYFTKPADLAPATKARSVDINNLSAAADAAFDKLPGLVASATDTRNYAVDTGAVNAIIAAVNPLVTALADGYEVRVKVAFASTSTTPTLNLNSIGAIIITRNDGTAILAADIPAGICRFAYNATTARWTYAPPGARGLTGNAGPSGSLLRRVATIASSATPTHDASLYDEMEVNALAVAATFAAPLNVPAGVNASVIFRIKDNGTARALAWNVALRAGTDLALPSSTTVNKWLYVGFKYNGIDAKWDLIAVMNNI